MKTFLINIKTVLVLLIMGTVLFGSKISVAQSLEGKWFPPGEKGVVLQFTTDNLIIYDFDKRIDAKTYLVEENTVKIDMDPEMILQLASSNRLLLKGEGGVETKDIIRLTPTKTNLTSSEIETKTYYFSDDDKKRSFKFNEPMGDSEKIFKLEKIDTTYFLSEFNNNRRRRSAPIEIITPEKIVVYLSPEKSMILRAKDVNDYIKIQY